MESEQDEQDGGAARRRVFTVWLIIFIDLLGFGIVLPSLPYFVAAFEVPAWAARAAGAAGLEMRGGLLVGVIMTAYSLMQFIFAPIWGRLSDRVGRRPVLAFSTGGFALTWVMFAFAPGFTVLLISRALAGVCAANISTAQAYMADAYPPERRARGMGLIGMAFGLGFVFGPAIGGVLVSQALISGVFGAEAGTAEYLRLQLMLPGLFAAGLSLVAFTLTLTVMREARVAGGQAAGGAPVSNPGAGRAREVRAGSPQHGGFKAFVEALRRPGIRPMLLVYFVVVLGFANLEAMFSQFNADHLGIAPSINAWVFVTIGLTLAVVQGGLIGRLTQWLGSRALLAVGLAGLSVMMFLFGFQLELNPGVHMVLWLLLLAVGVGAFNAVCNPSLLAIISAKARDDQQGGTMGFTASAATLGRMVGPITAGLIYDAAGPQWPFAVGGALIFLALGILALRWKSAAV